jgi:hypothetical protein
LSSLLVAICILRIVLLKGTIEAFTSDGRIGILVSICKARKGILETGLLLQNLRALREAIAVSFVSLLLARLLLVGLIVVRKQFLELAVRNASSILLGTEASQILGKVLKVKLGCSSIALSRQQAIPFTCHLAHLVSSHHQTSRCLSRYERVHLRQWHNTICCYLSVFDRLEYLGGALGLSLLDRAWTVVVFRCLGVGGVR